MLFATCHELNQASENPFKGLFAKGLFTGEDTHALILQIQHLAHGFPFLVKLEKTAVIIPVFRIGLHGEVDGKAIGRKLAEKPLTARVCPEIGGVQQPEVVVVASAHHLVAPFHVATAFVLAHGVAVSVKVAPAHKFLHILNLNVRGLDCIDVAEKMLREGAAVTVTGLASLGL